MSKICEIRKSSQFEAAHFLPKLPSNHPCSRIHGHSFKVTVIVRGPIDQDFGWVIDFGEINRHLNPLINTLDHNLLNDIPGLENPTSERLTIWLHDQLKPRFPNLHQVIVSETCTSESRYPIQDKP